MNNPSTARPLSELGLEAKVKVLAAKLVYVTELYRHLREDAVETQASKLHGAFQAAANAKAMGECYKRTDYGLRVKCTDCNGAGNHIEGEVGAQHLATCETCNGGGSIFMPGLEWVKNESVCFSLLPHDHPDYDGAPSGNDREWPQAANE